jgi:hypothetical protein
MREVQPIRDPEVIVAIQNYLKVRNFRNYLLFTMGIHCGIKSKFVCKFPQLERADYIIRVTFDTGFG